MVFKLASASSVSEDLCAIPANELSSYVKWFDTVGTHAVNSVLNPDNAVTVEDNPVTESIKGSILGSSKSSLSMLLVLSSLSESTELL